MPIEVSKTIVLYLCLMVTYCRTVLEDCHKNYALQYSCLPISMSAF